MSGIESLASTSASAPIGAPSNSAAAATSNASSGAQPASIFVGPDAPRDFMSMLASLLNVAQPTTQQSAPQVTLRPAQESDDKTTEEDTATVGAAAVTPAMLAALAAAMGRESSASAAPPTQGAVATVSKQSSAPTMPSPGGETTPSLLGIDKASPGAGADVLAFSVSQGADASVESKANKQAAATTPSDGQTSPTQSAEAQLDLTRASLGESRAVAHERAAATTSIEARVGSGAWADQIAARVALTHESGLHAASLKLTPEHLGPLEIQITVKNDQATVWFGAAHAETRAALEHAMPRLRELLQAQGMTLTDSGVFREPPREQAPAPGFYERSRAIDAAESEAELRIELRRRLLDAYA